MDWVRSSFHVTKHKQETFVANTTNKVVASGGSVVGATLLSLSSILLFLVFTFIYTFFFLLYRKLIMRFLESVFEENNKALVHEIIERVQFIIRKYIIGRRISTNCFLKKRAPLKTSRRRHGLRSSLTTGD